MSCAGAWPPRISRKTIPKHQIPQNSQFSNSEASPGYPHRSGISWHLAPFDIPALSQYCWPMESLHAPWRIEYILAPKPSLPDSLFTLIAQSTDDEANYVIARDRTCYALLN